MSRIGQSKSIEDILLWNINNPVEAGAIVGEGTLFEGTEPTYDDAQNTLPHVLLYHGKWIFNKSTNKLYQVVDDGFGGYLVQEKQFFTEQQASDFTNHIADTGNVHGLTNDQIVTILWDNTELVKMLSANRVNYNGEKTVKGIIDDIITSLGGYTQFNLYASRFIVDAETPNLTTYSLSGHFHPVHVAVNRLVYRGILSNDFENYAAIFDFRYELDDDTEKTIIFTNPAFNPRLSFNNGDVIDVLYSDDPITFIEE